jgi:YD repeat-containing protein
MNCQACGEELNPTQKHVNLSVGQIPETSLKDAKQAGGVCLSCGQIKQKANYATYKLVLFGLVLLCIVSVSALRSQRQTERALVANEVVVRISENDELVRMIGKPIAIGPAIEGQVKHDETGWLVARLTIPLQGPNGAANARVIGGRNNGLFVFTTLDVVVEKQHKTFDLVSGRVAEYEQNAYVEATQEYNRPAAVVAPRFNGEFPCVSAAVNEGKVLPQLGNCAMPTSHAAPVDRFEVDLRYGRFVLRQTDLYLADVFQVPLTRTYASDDWIHQNPVHAFGRNSNHPYDISPEGSRNPYTYQLIALEDSDFVYFDRISNGTSYADAVYQHTATLTRFYKATQAWNGDGWTTRLADGSEIRFPEAYNAKSMAQGAPVEMRDSSGNRLELRRDAARNLQEIRTPHGHWIRFSYDGWSRIVRVEDDAGNWARYEYNADGMLTGVFDSSGRARHYSYERTLMTEVADEKQHVLLRNWYEGNRVVKQEAANGGTYAYRYKLSPNRRYVESAVVTLPDRTTHEVEIPANAIPEMVRNLQ